MKLPWQQNPENRELQKFYEREKLKTSATKLSKNAEYRKNNPEKVSKNNTAYRLMEMKYRQELKAEVLSHYGKECSLRCCWPSCNESDIDVLTLDHIDNSGKDERKKGKRKTGARMYRHLKLLGFPDGFQTLCMNHQLKKEIRRKKQEVLARFIAS